MAIYRIHDVLNYGGFFAGDTVTVSARAVADPSEEKTFTIDQSALTNISGDRYKIVAGLALALQFEGERVSSATVIAAKERATLRQVVQYPISNTQSLAAPRLFAHHCAPCDLWILGEPHDGKCGVAGHIVRIAHSA
jgi:hypothetical protein